MFTNAGMNQFKDFFLGNATSNDLRVANTQKCLRVSGKHNDLEEVGFDTYHHTMFEMLGNWSFGDYFKKEAISWAWEFLVGELKLPADRLYVTVFEGDKALNLEKDMEAHNFWKEWISEERILNGSKKDNFWEMGDSGPCGPCSEIHIDLRPAEALKEIPGKDLVNKDHPLVIEIWNLVFIEFNRMADGTLVNLPSKHVDTGMGFERLSMALQGKTSTYDTDIFTPLISQLGQESGISYGDSQDGDVAMRVVADHIRAIGFTIADGQLPSNTGAGYVIRRILRRAVRYGYTFLGYQEPFLYRLIPVLSTQFDGVFDELKKQEAFVANVVKEEEAAFLKTLEKGLGILDGINKNKAIDGSFLFKLYDTYGFPKDLSLLILKEKGVLQNLSENWEKEFEKDLNSQKGRSKADAAKETGDWIQVHADGSGTFIGYDALECETRILKYRKVKIKGKAQVQIVLEQTPFYGESGGQVGDIGVLVSGNEKIPVLDTQKENDLIVHYTDSLPGKPEASIKAVVDSSRRARIMVHHSTTHLLHAALREVLGTHVEQRGSLVEEDGLRFDFSHFAKMSEAEIEAVETIVNKKVKENVPLVEDRALPMEAALKKGAMALFGEKYGDRVRVVTFDPDYSVELCGGTHVNATGKIGLFKIIGESSVAAGVRRIEALSGDAAEAWVRAQSESIARIKDLLKQPKDIAQSIQQLLEHNKALEKKVESLQGAQASGMKQELINKATTVGEAKIIIAEVPLDGADAVKKLAFELRNEVPGLVLVLGIITDDKPLLTIAIADDMVKKYGLHAGNLVRTLASKIQGGGGGQPFFATAGGKNPEGMAEALELAEEMLKTDINQKG